MPSFTLYGSSKNNDASDALEITSETVDAWVKIEESFSSLNAYLRTRFEKIRVMDDQDQKDEALKTLKAYADAAYDRLSANQAHWDQEEQITMNLLDEMTRELENKPMSGHKPG
jgi:hypothetical protein